MKNIFTILLFGLIITGCSDAVTTDSKGNKISKATGDRKAISLAKKVIEASGGKENWDKIPYVSFDYFGRRFWYWDKKNERYRVESGVRNLVAAGTLDGKETYLNFNEELITHPDSIAKFNELVYRMWVNDTYWLIFPFKLLDPGVKLKYIGECWADTVTKATCLELTFEKVGLTPGNRYIAYIDNESYDVIRWDYYVKAEDVEPTMTNKWTEYSQYGPVRLSRGRGRVRLGEVTIYEDLPEALFKDVTRSHTDILPTKNKEQ